MRPVGGVLALGVDLVEVARIEKLLRTHERSFLSRVFTLGEIAHSAGRRGRAQHLAARFAAKEAIMKALGTGLASGIRWQDVEVVTEASGAPSVALHGAALARARSLGIARWMLSLTHTRQHAMAAAVGAG